MPYLQPATANYFGFMPANASPGEIMINPYLVSSSEGNAIYPGDGLVISTRGTVRVTTGTWSSGIAGVAASFLAANGGSTVATLQSNTSQMVLVYDHPDQVFVGFDTTSGVLGSTKIGYNVPVLSTGATGSTGPNTTLNRSVMVLSGVDASTGAVLPFKIVGLHPVEKGVYSTVAAGTAGATGEVRKWLVQANLTARTGGFAIVTT